MHSFQSRVFAILLTFVFFWQTISSFTNFLIGEKFGFQYFFSPVRNSRGQPNCQGASVRTALPSQAGVIPSLWKWKRSVGLRPAASPCQRFCNERAARCRLTPTFARCTRPTGGRWRTGSNSSAPTGAASGAAGRPAWRAQSRWNAQLLIPVMRRFGVQRAHRVAQHPPQPQPADDVPAVASRGCASRALEPTIPETT